MFKLFKKRGKQIMTKEEFLALNEEQKNEILGWVQETKVEVKSKLDTQGTDTASQKKDEVKGQEKLDDTKKETKLNEEPADKEGKQDDLVKKQEESNDKKDENDAQKDIKTFGNDLKTLMEAQAKTLEKLEEYAKSNVELKAELEEIKKRSPMGNFHPKPSDNAILKEDQERDSFVDKVRNAYKN